MNISRLSRRSLLTSVGGIARITIARQAIAEAAESDNHPTKKLDTRKEFERLLPLWEVEREQFIVSSNTGDYWKGPHGKGIIALGAAIIPLLIQKLRSGDFRFNVPLALITKVDITNGEYVSEQHTSKLWIKWWETGKRPSPK